MDVSGFIPVSSTTQPCCPAPWFLGLRDELSLKQISSLLVQSNADEFNKQTFGLGRQHHNNIISHKMYLALMSTTLPILFHEAVLGLSMSFWHIVGGRRGRFRTF